MKSLKFDALDYELLYHHVFTDEYPGYRPTVGEIPNGDGRKDVDKRYAHVALKYRHSSPVVQKMLDRYLAQAHSLAVKVAMALGVPAMYHPNVACGALRVLEYPVGATSAPHLDFDLFTINLYRNQPRKFVAAGREALPDAALDLDPHLHIGEIGELVGLGPATMHEVLPSDTVQRSIVYFAIPEWGAPLAGTDVGSWLTERLSRSRYDK